jgi:hypothetical protein
MPVRECVRTWRARPQREQANGPYVPATTTKIIEWSSRRIPDAPWASATAHSDTARCFRTAPPRRSDQARLPGPGRIPTVSVLAPGYEPNWQRPLRRRGMTQERAGAREESHDGYEKELADYERELARYLQARIKPGLSRGASPLLARSIAKGSPGRRRPSRSRAATPRRPEVARLRASRRTCTSSRRGSATTGPALLGPWRGRLADRREAGLEPARRGAHGRAAGEDRRGDRCPRR